MIAKILGATNWQENPVATLKDIKNLLGMGGIVAQRLEENGFVKFANGFTIQWGIVKRGRLDVWYTSPTQFPIAFTEVYVGVGTIQESATERSSSNFDNAVRLSLDKIEFAKFEHYYIALGKS